jgi:hypothetical protein
MASADLAREMLRHTLATLAYRAGKALRGAPEGFASFSAGGNVRTPGQILAHLGDLFDWALTLAKGAQKWNDSPPLDWDAGSKRFFEAVERFEAYLASDAPLGSPPEKLFQGPIADGLAHVGQIALLRRLAGGPIRPENYHQADIAAGRVGPQQSPPRREF